MGPGGQRQAGGADARGARGSRSTRARGGRRPFLHHHLDADGGGVTPCTGRDTRERERRGQGQGGARNGTDAAAGSMARSARPRRAPVRPSGLRRGQRQRGDGQAAGGATCAGADERVPRLGVAAAAAGSQLRPPEPGPRQVEKSQGGPGPHTHVCALTKTLRY